MGRHRDDVGGSIAWVDSRRNHPHVSNILSKLEVSNRAEAVALALRNKLVT
jgi:hypothetical protein